MPDRPPTDSTPPPSFQLIPANYPLQEDEFSLYDVALLLLGYRTHIAVVTALCAAIALLYALLQPPVYEARAWLSPPEAHDVVGLARAGNNPPPPQAVFEQFLDNFQSRALRWRYFEDNDLLTALRGDDVDPINTNAVFEGMFNNKLLFIPEEKKAGGGKKSIIRASATLQAREATLAAAWLNGFVDYVNEETVASLKRDIASSLQQRRQSIEDDIAGWRGRAEKVRGDSIIRLQEADEIKRRDIENQIQTLKGKFARENSDQRARLMEAMGVAERLNIENFMQIWRGAGLGGQAEGSAPDLLDLRANVQGLPDYTRGKQALAAEIAALEGRASREEFVTGLRELQAALSLLEENPEVIGLQNRQSDDPYIGNLRDLEKEYDGIGVRLQRLADDETIRAITIEQYAVAPRAKTKRTLILLLGLMGGVMLGVLVALLWHFIEQTKIRMRAG